MGPSPLTQAHPSSLPLAAWGPIQHSDTSSKKQGCSQTLSSPGLQALPVSPVLSLALSWVHAEQPGHGGELRVLRRTSRMTQRKQGEVFSWQVPPQAATRERFPARGNWSWPPSSSSSGLRLCFSGWRLLCAKTGGGSPSLGRDRQVSVHGDNLPLHTSWPHLPLSGAFCRMTAKTRLAQAGSTPLLPSPPPPFAI